MIKTRVQLRELSAVLLSSTTCGSLFHSPTMTYSLLNTIPPERVGLNGEYDHSGLAKRVWQAFQADFSAAKLESLRVTQRGKVVVLMGNLAAAAELEQMVAIALNVDGAIAVETTGIRFR